jgi:tripartite-type tricarboxylate transporter receptor subunit TctC
MKKLWGACAALLLAVSPAGAFAQDKYPNQPIRLIVPFPPGGGTDIMSRVVATELGKLTGWTVVPDNKPGSGGSLGLSLGSKARADGYTLVMAQNANLVINPLLGIGNYDPVKDFEPVLLVASGPMVMVVAKDSKYQSVVEVLAAAKDNPGSVKFASPGVGTSGHLAGELVEQLSGAKFLHVPYKGVGPALPDLLGGRVDIYIGSAPSLMTQIKEGSLRCVTVFDRKRHSEVPEAPTIVELGFANGEAVTWWGIVAPAGTPKEIVDLLNKEINATLRRPETQAQLKNVGAEILGSTVQELAELIQKDVPKWQAVIERADIKRR